MKTYARRVCLGGQKVLAGVLLLGFAMVGEWAGATPISQWALDSRYTPPPRDQVNLWGESSEKAKDDYIGLLDGLGEMPEKREYSRYDAPIIQDILKKNPFTTTIPSMYMSLINGNKKIIFFRPNVPVKSEI